MAKYICPFCGKNHGGNIASYMSCVSKHGNEALKRETRKERALNERKSAREEALEQACSDAITKLSLAMELGSSFLKDYPEEKTAVLDRSASLRWFTKYFLCW